MDPIRDLIAYAAWEASKACDAEMGKILTEEHGPRKRDIRIAEAVINALKLRGYTIVHEDNINGGWDED